MSADSADTGNADSDLKRFYWRSWLDLLEHVEVYRGLSDCLSTKWSRLPTVCALLTALTATGSGIAGWTIWATPGGRTIWAIFAGIASLSAIVSASLGFSTKSEAYASVHGKLSSLSKRLRTFQEASLRRTVAIDEKMHEKLDAFREEWDDLPTFRDDFFNTQSLRLRIQTSVEYEYIQRGWLEPKE